MIQQKCYYCKKIKLIDDFKTPLNEIRKSCNECRVIRKEQSTNNRTAISLRTKAYRNKNKDKINTYAKTRRQNCPDQIREIKKKCYYNNIDKNLKRLKSYRENNRFYFLMKNVEKSCKIHKLPCNIDINYLIDIWTPTCPIFGITLEWGTKKQNSNSPSLDRIIPKLGYIRGNVVFMSLKANILKSNSTIDEQEKVLQYIINPNAFIGQNSEINDLYDINQIKGKISRIKTKSKTKNINCDIEFNDLWNILPKDNRCPILNTLFIKGDRGGEDQSMSIDKIDPKKGYTKGNICVICKKANSIKGNGNIDEHTKILQFRINNENKNYSLE